MRAAVAGRPRLVGRWLLLAAAGHLLAVAMLLVVPLALAPAPGSHAYAAASHVLVGYASLHCLLATVMALFGFARVRAGFVSSRRTLDLRVGLQWHGYAAVAGAIVLVILHGVPMVLSR